jgi:hypothetical protein
MAKPRKVTKPQPSKKLRTFETRTEEVPDEPKKEVEKEITPAPSPKGHMETVVTEEYYNACKQDLLLGGQRFVPGAIIPKEIVSNLEFYLQGGHIARRRKLQTVRKLK